MMNRTEMNNEMLEQVNGGTRMVGFAATSELASGNDVAADFTTMDLQAMDFTSERKEQRLYFGSR